jgi:hypothetical protein
MEGRMMATRDLIHLNNLGVMLLESGKMYQSRQLFCLATELMKTTLDQEMIRQSWTRDYVESEIPSAVSSSSGFASSSPYSSSRHHHLLSSSHGEQHFGELSFQQQQRTPSSIPLHDFLRPVYFSEDIIGSSSSLPLVKLSISLIFNLALSNHIIAMQEEAISPSSSTVIEDAIFLYQLALRLQHDGGIELSCLHTMGMINNVGKLLAYVGFLEEAQTCFQHLLKHLMVQVDKSIGGGLARRPEVNKEQIESFIDNILQMVLRNSETSPAA